MKNIELQPNRTLYLSVRAAFIRQGTSLAAWCRIHRYNQSNVAAALMGAWNGPAGQRIRQQVIKDSGVLGKKVANEQETLG